MAGMPLIYKLGLRFGTLFVGCFFAFLLVVGLVVQVIRKGWNGVFSCKNRSSPPACMQDPNLGTHGYIHLERVRLHYVSNGAEDKPLMLLVHGFPEFWYSWRHQLREFKDSYRVVAVDQRGYGDSDKPGSVSDYAVSLLVDDLRQLVTALGYKKCVLAGHDWGGLVTWAFAQTCPNMVDRFIVLNSPAPGAFTKHLLSSFSQIRKSWYMALFQVPWIPDLFYSTSDLAIMNEVFKGKEVGVRANTMTDEDVEAYKFTYQRNGFTAPLNYYRALCRYPEFFFYRLRDVKVVCPTLIIWGCQDRALGRELAALSMDCVSGEVTVKYIEEASHWTPMDQYHTVNSYIREFLESTDGKSE